ncbi:MAG TPA: hypothetical protein VFI77_01280, partial [Gemmatimonadales bacterium]|nr:hypothetical protein [Gemmatimonadales bacterium]
MGEHAVVGRLVPGPRLPGPPRVQIALAHHVAGGEHAVELAQIVVCHLVRPGHRAVMGIVEEQPVAPPRGAMTSDRGHQ